MLSPFANRGERFSLALPCLLIFGLCGLPLVFLAAEIFSGSQDGTALEKLGTVLSSLSVARAAWHSLETSLVSACFATLVGTLLALAIGLTDIRRKGLFVFLLLLPMMIPPHVTAIAWIQALGPGSPVLRWFNLAPELGSTHPLYSRGGLILLLTIQNAPLAFLIMRAALRSMPRELMEAGRLSGAHPLRLLLRIQIPLLYPALLAAFMLAFVAALGNFGINAILGIPARYITLPVLIWQRLSSFGPDVIGDMAIVALVLGLITIAALILQFGLQRGLGTALIGPPSQPLSYRLGRWRWRVEFIISLFLALVLFLPALSLLATALVPTYGVPLTPETLTFKNLHEVLMTQAVTVRAFVNSTLLAGAAALVIAASSVLLAHGLILRTGTARRVSQLSASLAEVAFALPGIVMSIAFILVFIRPLPYTNLSLYGTSTIILLAYIAVFFTVGLKPVVASYAQLDLSLDDAARVSGARFLRRMWRIFAPLVAPAAVSGAILVFLTAYNEVTVSALLWSSGSETIGTVIFNYEDGGYTTLAAAMSVIVVFATALIMLATSLIFRRVPDGVIPWRN